MTTFTIRRAVREDAGGMADVLNPIIAAGGTTALETPVDADAMRAMTFDRAGHIAVHVAVDAGGRIAGFQWLERRDGLPDDVGDLATFARLSPKLPGVGTALFAATVGVAREAGLTALNATIRADNTGGLAYYTKMGFRDHGLARGVPLADGTLVDRVSKRYAL